MSLWRGSRGDGPVRGQARAVGRSREEAARAADSLCSLQTQHTSTPGFLSLCPLEPPAGMPATVPPCPKPPWGVDPSPPRDPQRGGIVWGQEAGLSLWVEKAGAWVPWGVAGGTGSGRVCAVGPATPGPGLCRSAGRPSSDL